MAKVRWSLKTQLRRLEEQAAVFLKHGNLTRSRKEIEKELKKPGREGLASIDLRMGDIQREESAIGAIAVLKGDAAGWQHVQTGLAYHDWNAESLSALASLVSLTALKVISIFPLSSWLTQLLPEKTTVLAGSADV
jgi:hypothetical protein